MANIDLGRRLLLAFGAARFIVVGELSHSNRALLNDAGSDIRTNLLDVNDTTYLICVDLSDDELASTLSDPLAKRSSGIYVQHHATQNIKTREELERICFELDYRKHPAYHRLFGYEELEQCSPEFATVLQPIGIDVSSRFPMALLLVERDLHMDMLREAGRRSDAHVIRYDWVSQFIRPNDTVLDAACGLGYGTHVMRHLSRGGKYIGIDGSEWAVDYATACFGSVAIKFSCGMLPNALAELKDASIDVVVSFETLEHVADPVGLLSEFWRVLRPGGRIVASVPNDWSDETGEDPNPHHLHVYTWHRLAGEISKKFIIEHAARQIASGCKRIGVDCEWTERPRTLKFVEPQDASQLEAEWWLVVAMKSPSHGRMLPYQETVHDVFEGATHLVDFGAHYLNPWHVHAVVEIPYRLRQHSALAVMADDMLTKYPVDSPDCGAALAVLSYRALEDSTRNSNFMVLEGQIANYLALQSINPHVLRWQVSLGYVRARLRLRRGDRKGALLDFTRVAKADVSIVTPTLGTKTVDAAFWAGMLLWLSDEHQSAREWWQRGIEDAGKLLGCDWIEFYGNLDSPLVFAMNDVVEIADRATACTQALSITYRPSPGASASLHAIGRQSLRSAVRQLGNDLNTARDESANLRKSFDRVCKELENEGMEKSVIEALSLERLNRIHLLEARLNETDVALNSAKEISLRRLDQVQELETRLYNTDVAFDKAKALSLQRLEQVQSLETRLSDTDIALNVAKALSLQRLEQVQSLESRLNDTDIALNTAKVLSLQRLEQVESLEARLSDTDIALNVAKALSLQRLQQIQALETRLSDTDLALNDTKELSLQRLEQVHTLEMRLGETDAALNVTKKLSLQRLQKIHSLEAQLNETDSALKSAMDLSFKQMEEVRNLEASLAETGIPLETAKQVHLELFDRVSRLEQQVEVSENPTSAFPEINTSLAKPTSLPISRKNQ